MQPRSTKRADKRRSMEEAVLDTATEMLREGGPEALTIAGLAAQLDVSVGGLYRYYPSKGAILVGLEKRAITSYREVMDALLLALEPRCKRHAPEVAALARVLAAATALRGGAPTPDGSAAMYGALGGMADRRQVGEFILGFMDSLDRA